MTKPLSVAFQMDPLGSLHPQRDTTLLLIKEALKRQYNVYMYEPSGLFLDNGTVRALGKQLSLQFGADLGLESHEPLVLELETMDVIWIRQDPPFDMAYLTTTYFLERLAHPTIINHPAGIRASPEKLLATRFPQWMPATLITQCAKQACEFFDQQGSVIIKPLYEYGGRFIYKADSHEIIETIFQKEKNRIPGLPLVVQRFLPAIYQGDKRIFILDGTVIGCFRRIPQENNFLSNFSQGATAARDVLTDHDHDLCQSLMPLLQELGLFFVGLDVIDEHLIEINVTSPTGVPTYNELYQTCLEKTIWDRVLGKLI